MWVKVIRKDSSIEYIKDPSIFGGDWYITYFVGIVSITIKGNYLTISRFRRRWQDMKPYVRTFQITIPSDVVISQTTILCDGKYVDAVVCDCLCKGHFDERMGVYEVNDGIGKMDKIIEGMEVQT